ncbi:MAG: hypothetical protein Q9225_006300 [Loekoesia sp. 1 TL-2023]
MSSLPKTSTVSTLSTQVTTTQAEDTRTDEDTTNMLETSGGEGLAGAIDDDQGHGLLTWSSPLPDVVSAEDIFKFTANGEYLEFLSLFLTTPRQVDIAFSKRHALIVFLMESLEKSFWNYAQRTIPEELEALQVLSPDEFEPHVWEAFLSVNVCDENGRRGYFGGERIANIRHTAVHRYDFDTSIIRAAAAQASRNADGKLLRQLDLVLRVLYADVATDLRFPVTEEQRMMVNDLLWPSNCPITSTHQLFDRVQNLGERSSYEFCKQYLPQILARRDVTAAEHFELPQWHHIIREQPKHVVSSPETGKILSEVSEKLQETWGPRGLRNAAAHREMIYINEGNKLEILTQLVAEYVRILGDEVTATTIE